ncbi:hypothetical protein AVEN_195676-1 [Araneus ventricosus]|uniref:Uncharacterized protein n=1 Tax=Araneus ventricosus TaxID=182803 RepID=A0A4Y2BAA2_ARAVE|nr:hypothetical protein AVEN_195676-1 [Araneus ventricosus]
MELQRHSRSKVIPVDQRRSSDLSAVLKYSLRQAVTPHGVFSSIPFPSRNIEKRVAFSGIIYLSPRSPNLSPNRQNGRHVCRQGQGAITVAEVTPCLTL